MSLNTCDGRPRVKRGKVQTLVSVGNCDLSLSVGVQPMDPGQLNDLPLHGGQRMQWINRTLKAAFSHNPDRAYQHVSLKTEDPQITIVFEEKDVTPFHSYFCHTEYS